VMVRAVAAQRAPADHSGQVEAVPA
jgi:hypothetical protein